MRRASDIFNDGARKEVARAVAEAESKTTAEIVPVVATCSGRYDRAEDLAGFISALAAFIIAWLLFQREDPSSGGWDGLPITMQLPVLVLILFGGFITGTFAAMHIGWLRRALTPAQHMTDEVIERAGTLLFDHRIHHTDAATGVLIYISLFERRASILADKGVLEALGAEAIQHACDELTGSLRTKPVAEALKTAIADLGQRLSEALPRDGDDANELDDVLIIID